LFKTVKFNEELAMTAFTTDRVHRYRSTAARRWMFLAVCLAFFAAILDTTIVNVALPAIGATFRTTVTNLQWAVNGYNIVFAALLLTCGALADRRGGKRAFGAGTAIFVAGSLVCGLAPAFPVLLAGRVIQGLGAALVMPASLALIAHAYPEPAARTKAVAGWAACAGAGFATGPVLGGVLVDAVGWRAIFLVNLPVGLIALALLARYATETPTSTRSVDLPGQILGIIVLAAVAFGITEAGAYGWGSTYTIVPLVVAIAVVAVFVVIERNVASPLLPPSLLAHRSFSAATGVGLLLNFGIYGQVFVLSLYFQQMRHFSALTTGLMVLPFAGLTMVLPPLTGRIAARYGPRYIMITGQVLLAAGAAILAVAGLHTAYLLLLPGLILLGLGMAATMPSMTAAVMLAAPREFAGIASGVLNAARQVGGVLGIALLGTLIADKVHFVTGMHTALAIVTGTFLLGAVLAALCSNRPQQARAADAPRQAAAPATATTSASNG
jgi:DHA2 family methylenomycin A resistance protein-like MFS transporter